MANQNEHSENHVQFSKALTRIHEGLLATSLLQHPKAADVKRGNAFVSHKSTETWHRFLDELCQLCQFDKGAGNTTSIAVAEAEVHCGPVTFWLATNTGSKRELEGSRNKRRDHLVLCLKALQRISKSDDWEKKREESKSQELIIHKSVKLSHDKLDNCQKGLQRFVKSARNLLKADGTWHGEDESLLSALDTLIRERDRVKLCDLAYRFRASPSADILKSKINHTAEGTWREIRHCIGRLGALRNAAMCVTSKADWFSKELQNFRVSCVETEPTIHEAHVDLGNGFRDVLQRVCSRLSKRDVLDTTAEKMKRATGVIEKFGTGSKETVIHAEAAMAHHFYMNNIKFLHGDKYIGCSKPSCYGCTLYLTEHPGLFHPRQTSGNAYLKWAPPLHKDESLNLDGATMRTLRAMISRIDSDLLSNAENRSFSARPQFDSTTGKTQTGYAETGVE